MASGRLEVVRRSDNTAAKLLANISEKKQITVTLLNDKAYLHLSETKKGTTKREWKSVSYNMEEVAILRSFLLDIESQVHELMTQSELQTEIKTEPIPAQQAPMTMPMPMATEPIAAQQAEMPMPKPMAAEPIPAQRAPMPAHQQMPWGLQYPQGQYAMQPHPMYYAGETSYARPYATEQIYDRQWTDMQGLEWRQPECVDTTDPSYK